MRIFCAALVMKNFLPLLFAMLTPSMQVVAQESSRLSPFTRQYLQELDSRATSSAEPIPGYVYKQAQDGTPLLSAFLQVAPTFSEEALIPLGVRIGTRAGNVWTAQIPPASLRAVTNLTGLRYIQLDEPVTPQLDSARRATRVDSVHAGLGLPQAFHGQGVSLELSTPVLTMVTLPSSTPPARAIVYEKSGNKK